MTSGAAGTSYTCVGETNSETVWEGQEVEKVREVENWSLLLSCKPLLKLMVSYPVYLYLCSLIMSSSAIWV